MGEMELEDSAALVVSTALPTSLVLKASVALLLDELDSCAEA